jgi:protein farnesyltransferase/geranylgeranyltransferase type-1 subunit alpha
MASGEISQRALDLTADALDQNPANYSVWHHRRHLLKELKSDISAELNYCRDVIEQHPKNYQVWYVICRHRTYHFWADIRS